MGDDEENFTLTMKCSVKYLCIWWFSQWHSIEILHRLKWWMSSLVSQRWLIGDCLYYINLESIYSVYIYRTSCLQDKWFKETHLQLVIFWKRYMISSCLLRSSLGFICMNLTAETLFDLLAPNSQCANSTDEGVSKLPRNTRSTRLCLCVKLSLWAIAA